MKNTRVFIMMALVSILAYCNTSSTYHPSMAQDNPPEVLSPFAQFETIIVEENGINGEQVDNILKSYYIYDKILSKITVNDFYDSSYNNIKINGFVIGNKKVALLLIDKGHLYIYVMFSNDGNKWIANGFAYQKERDKPEYRIEQSSDGTSYWLVVRKEANHGTGVSIYNEIWYNPDGSVAAEFPLEGSTLFFPQYIDPEANASFSTSVHYDGNSAIFLSYSISFKYSYQGSYRSEYRPIIREHWEFDLQSQQLKFVSCDPDLPEGFSTMKHEMSGDYGMLQGYIDFYRMRLGDKKITTLVEWEKFMELND